jgi:hypothetical protein
MDHAINEIMRTFNWNKVRRAMIALNWYWSDIANGVPSVDELKATGRDLLKDVLELSKDNTAKLTTGSISKDSDIRVSMGGLAATYMGGSLMLQFIVAESQSSNL